MMKLSIEEIVNIMKNLQKDLDMQSDREIYLSECDFQLNLAQKLKDNKYDVILEYPIKTDELYIYKKGASDNTTDSISYIDIFCRNDNDIYFIELKYKTMQEEEEVTRYGNKFVLKPHTCHTDNRHDVYKDIERLECCKKWYKEKYHKDCTGYVIFLTNYPKHHNPSLYQKKYILADKIKPLTEPNLKIEGEYDVSWHEFKKESKFEYLLIKI